MRIRIDVGEGHIEVQASKHQDIDNLIELLCNAVEGLKPKEE